MTRDQVIEAAKDWVELMQGSINWHKIAHPFWMDELMTERQTWRHVE